MRVGQCIAIACVCAAAQVKPDVRFVRNVSELRAAVNAIPQAENPLEIVLADGEWRLDSPISISKTECSSHVPVTIRAEHVGKAILTTAKRTNSISKSVKVPGAWQIELKSIGIDLPSKARLALVRSSPPPLPSVYVDGKRLFLASWPNGGEWAHIEKVVVYGAANGDHSPTNKFGQPNVPGIFQYSEDVPSRWVGEKNFWIHGYFKYDWRDDLLCVKSVDPKSKTIELGARATYGLGKGNPSPRRWRAINVLPELDVPGEYHVDLEGGVLTLLPPKDVSMKDAVVEVVPWIGSAIELSGAEDVSFKGLVVRRVFQAVVADRCRNVSFDSCEFSSVQDTAVRFTDAWCCSVRDSCVRDVGVSGIEMSGGDRKTLKSAGNIVDNCEIGNIGILRRTCSVAFSTSGVGNVFTRNFVHDTPHTAILVDWHGGNDCVFSANVISNCCSMSDDAGAFYKGRNPSARGNRLIANYFVECGLSGRHGTCAVYFDDGDCGDIVVGNYFRKCGRQDSDDKGFGAIFTGGGYQFVCTDNVFIDCDVGIGDSPWAMNGEDGDRNWITYLANEQQTQQLHKDVDIQCPVWQKHYPELKNFLPGEPYYMRTNFANRCVFVNCGQSVARTWHTNATCRAYTADPGFVDADRSNYTFRSDSRVFSDIHGFKPAPFDKIGPDRRRWFWGR